VSAPLITVAVPSLNQGKFIGDALRSLMEQRVELEVFVADGGSTDESLQVISRWESRLAGWRSRPDGGQAAAINEAVARGRAPFVCWLNSDDWLEPDGLRTLAEVLRQTPEAPAVYGRTWDLDHLSKGRRPTWVEPFDAKRLALRCIVSQPGTLIRRSVWERLGGLDESLHMAMDYDLWWRIYLAFGQMQFVDRFVAVNRLHAGTKTSTQRARHYAEAMAVVRRHSGRLPLKWVLAQPYKVWWLAHRNARRSRPS
jgi:hypothetical protein